MLVQTVLTTQSKGKAISDAIVHEISKQLRVNLESHSREPWRITCPRGLLRRT